VTPPDLECFYWEKRIYKAHFCVSPIGFFRFGRRKKGPAVFPSPPKKGGGSWAVGPSPREPPFACFSLDGPLGPPHILMRRWPFQPCLQYDKQMGTGGGPIFFSPNGFDCPLTLPWFTPPAVWRPIRTCGSRGEFLF